MLKNSHIENSIDSTEIYMPEVIATVSVFIFFCYFSLFLSWNCVYCLLHNMEEIIYRKENFLCFTLIVMFASNYAYFSQSGKN